MLNKNNNKPKLKKEGGDAAGVGGDSWFPLHVVGALRHAIEAERQAPYRKDVIKTSLEVRATRKFDEENALQVGLFDEPNFDDRYSRTPERVRQRADHILKPIDDRDLENTVEVRGATLSARMASAQRHSARL